VAHSNVRAAPLTTLLDELEHEARQRALTLQESGKLRPGFVEWNYPLNATQDRERRRLKAALTAATDADTFVALVKGESVPSGRLERDVVQYQRRRTT
jgi:hypothetical protein